MRKVGWVVSMTWLQYAYVVALDHCPSYIDLLDPSHIYLIHFNIYQQTHLLAKWSKVAMIVNFPYFNVQIRAQGVYGMDRDDTIEDYHDFSVIFAIELMELSSK